MWIPFLFYQGTCCPLSPLAYYNLFHHIAFTRGTQVPLQPLLPCPFSFSFSFSFPLFSLHGKLINLYRILHLCYKYGIHLYFTLHISIYREIERLFIISHSSQIIKNNSISYYSLHLLRGHAVPSDPWLIITSSTITHLFTFTRGTLPPLHPLLHTSFPSPISHISRD
jgi:hypothetical protein